ncbi:MAG: hypothetical protein HOE94_01145, partial [Gemmatimonadales bacterium]|nr:hypothetical protein [Gemmatimonadales bacterium]MBT5046806.1 hypothetical protein [Gemmatimonadales bacterium]
MSSKPPPRTVPPARPMRATRRSPLFSKSDAGEVRFHEAARLTPEHWAELQYVLQRRVLQYFRRHGLLDEVDAHGMLSWQGSGGFSIDASVRIEGEDRAGVERLLRYCA